jgi:hypothetical protein
MKRIQSEWGAPKGGASQNMSENKGKKDKKGKTGDSMAKLEKEDYTRDNMIGAARGIRGRNQL